MGAPYVFQSPRSGKFVSNKEISLIDAAKLKGFNPLDQGNIYIGSFYITRDAAFGQIEFQSPRSGKFVSDMMQKLVIISTLNQCFNPLDRGNLYQIPNANGTGTDTTYSVSIP